MVNTRSSKRLDYAPGDALKAIDILGSRSPHRVQKAASLANRARPPPRAGTPLLAELLRALPDVQRPPLHLLNFPKEVKIRIAEHLVEDDARIAIREDQLQAAISLLPKFHNMGVIQTFQLPGGPFPGIGMLRACKTLREDADEILKGYTLFITLVIRGSKLVCVVVGNRACFNTRRTPSAQWAADFLKQCAESTTMVVHPRAIRIEIINDSFKATDPNSYGCGLKWVLHHFCRTLSLYTTDKNINIDYFAEHPGYHSGNYDIQTWRDSNESFRVLRCKHVVFRHNLEVGFPYFVAFAWEDHPTIAPVLRYMTEEIKSKTPVSGCMALYLDIHRFAIAQFYDWSIGLPNDREKAIYKLFRVNDYAGLQGARDYLTNMARDPVVGEVKDLLKQPGGTHTITARKLFDNPPHFTFGETTERIDSVHFRWWDYNTDGTRKEPRELYGGCRAMPGPASWLY